jgi:hypothetical protein
MEFRFLMYLLTALISGGAALILGRALWRNRDLGTELQTRKDGNRVARYIEGSQADHFAMAENYCMAAMEAPVAPEYPPAHVQKASDLLGGI